MFTIVSAPISSPVSRLPLGHPHAIERRRASCAEIDPRAQCPRVGAEREHGESREQTRHPGDMNASASPSTPPLERRADAVSADAERRAGGPGVSAVGRRGVAGRAWDGGVGHAGAARAPRA